MISLFHLTHGRKNGTDLVRFLADLFLMLVCWWCVGPVVGWWCGGCIVVLVITRWCSLVYIHHFFYVLQSLLLLFALLLQYVDDFRYFAFRISGSALSPY